MTVAPDVLFDSGVASTTATLEDVSVSPEASPQPWPAKLPEKASRYQKASVTAMVLFPMLGVGYAMVRLWSHGITWFDLTLGLATYLLTGLGITVGFHRLFTHRSFKARRWLKVVLAVSGSMAAEGSLTSWVSQHRRHHVFSDREEDPHSPNRYGRGFWPQLKGLVYAQFGWLFATQRVDPERWSPDLLADKDLVLISATAPLWAIVSLVIPFGIGFAVTRSVFGALLAGLWGGVVRMALLHHITWSINSICHMFGKRPFRSKDESRNFAPLAVFSFGESWHNSHHAFPAMARHGVGRGQFDPSARLIRVLEALTLVRDVRWPSPDRLAARRVACAASSAGTR